MMKSTRCDPYDGEPFRLDLHGVRAPRTNLSMTNLEGANFTGADFTGANWRGVDLKEARLEGTILRGADLTGAKNLTVEQLRSAVIDETTKLPEGFELEHLLRSP